jgi:PucR C-terminal helix-turn-helix domain
VATQQESASRLEQHPWEALSAQTADVLRPINRVVTDEIIDAIRHEVPAYSRPLEGAFGAGVRMGVEQALAQFVALIEDPGIDRSSGRELYVRLGRGEAREGRSLEALLAAYRVGARVAWRRVAEAAREAGLDSEVLALLAESIFAYIDELSAESAEGFAQEQAAAAGESQRRRRRLLSLLIESPPADPGAIEDAARHAGWELPGSLAALVWRSARRRVASRLPEGALVATIEELDYALIPDPGAPGMRRQLEAALGGLPAGLGPAVAWPEAGLSARRALAALRLALAGRIPADGLAAAEEHLAPLILHADDGLLDDLAERRLSPLEGQTQSSRARLTETLRSWLDHQGNVAEMAAQLHVHPQTVRYRLGRLRDCFGPELDDPGVRFELGLVLHART